MKKKHIKMPDDPIQSLSLYLYLLIAASAAAAAEAVVSYILSFGADEFRMNVNEIFREANASECATEKTR